MIKYTYSFTVWPDSKNGQDQALFELFQALLTRVEMPFTEVDFNRFRNGLVKHGLTLREIERIPFVESERVL